MPIPVDTQDARFHSAVPLEDFRALVEICPDAILINRNNRIAYINQSGLRLLKAQSLEQMVGKSIFDLLLPDDRKFIAERIRLRLEHGLELAPIELQLVCLDGSLVEVEVAACTFPASGGT